MSMLTKSDFKVARTCATKLYYRKRRYPTTLEENEYLEFLADGGFMVETLARLHFPKGTEMPFQAGVEDAAQQSAVAFANDPCALFEATFIAGKLMARVDILERKARDVRIIEVKAKSIDTSEDLEKLFWSRNGVRPEWEPYLEDVAFQTLVLRRGYPDLSFAPFLCMPDKSKTTSIDLLHKHFAFEVDPQGQGAKIKRPEVSFIGDAEAARRDSFLSVVDVSEWVERLLPEVEEAADHFADELDCGAVRAKTPIGTNCKDCEFRVEGKEPSGFAECWGPLAGVSPHILDYYYAGTIGGRGAPAVQGLLAKGQAGLADVTEGTLMTTKGEVGPIAQRQRLQREYTLRNEEYRSPALAPLLAGHRYPLHFIDFEASRVAIPYHAGMRPYEQVCFQWSCHTIREPEGALDHADWLNLDDVYPNHEFASSLAERLGTDGTIYIWSPFEVTALRTIREQLEAYGRKDQTLEGWLDLMIDRGSSDGRLAVVDLCELAKLHYFHPRMKGRLSIKYVLPAVWESNPSLWANPAFMSYFARDAQGAIMNPYDTLPGLPFADEELAEAGEPQAIREGTAAMRAYQELLYGPSSRVPERKAAWGAALRQYCKLDTAAMVMIWEHWRRNSPP